MARLPGPTRALSVPEQRRVVTVVAILMAAVAAIRLPRVKGDPAVYLDALHRMRHGTGYYRAMDLAMRAYQIGPVETTRAFRPPTAFVLWRWLPNDHLVWIAFLALTVVATVALLWVVRVTWCALLFTGYMILVGFQGYSTPELWSVALIAIGISLAWHRHTIPALAVLVVATSFRELAILAVIGVVIDGWDQPRVRRAAAGCGAVLVGLYLLQSRGTEPFLVPKGQGREAKLLGSAHLPMSFLQMSGAWVPAGIVLGPVLLWLTIHWLRQVKRLWLLVPLLCLLLSGFVVHRVEWGMLVVPFTLTLGVDEVLAIRRRAAVAPAQTVDTVANSLGTASS